jgi:flagellar hook-length control protein FliK
MHDAAANSMSGAVAAADPNQSGIGMLSGGTPDTVDTTGALMRIARAVHEGTPTLSIELHPAELGRIEVRLSFRDSGVGVQMTLDRQDTYAAFNRDRAALEQQLTQAGVTLGGGGLDLRYGQQSQQQPQQPMANALRTIVSASAPSSDAQAQAGAQSDSLIDIMV